ncbi:ABC transporter substrate-binding protein [Rhodococcus aetherivorans]|uniref:ABC transporter substrate-binding protein n=1 Tax=Rhodococcus TaxID=1827 RepID=UPI00045D10BE|nr:MULTISPECIES: ABC transporter substrate-binding protein [Rhodococcus]AKE89275.1 ABC transporter substrate-binding protein [Rhodococcus aetherivorans]KDE14289.1 ABC transporter substrate-binding protein [Rhodococcus aetherivorans]MBC2590945.1 ABC transporter substrate-binding protein [Rhodococcus aetherivorans]MDV6292532.1 ABC transporter substrate-binding protein [Rhodococcus aetherivorans]PND53028.1 ABC transporter substrate-binding protein [Rhodococcus sp. ENV425]
MRVGLVGAAAVLALSSVAACGSESSGTVLSFYTAADGAEQYAAAAANCTAAAGGRYTIEQRTLPKGADDQRLQLARRLTGDDDTLDLMTLDVVWTAEFAEAGWALPLPPDVAASVSEGTLAGPLASATWQDTLYAAPLNTNTQLLWYRKDLMPGGRPPQTWDEMIDIASGLADEGRPSWIGVQARQYEGLMVWFNTLLASAGGSVVAEDGTTVTVADGDAAVTALDIMKRVATAPGADPSLNQSDEAAARLGMESGKAAFQVNWPFVYPGILENAEKGFLPSIDDNGNVTAENTGNTVLTVNGEQNFLPAPYPAVIAGTPARVTIGGFNIAVARTSRNPDLAFEAMQCLRNEENQRNNAVDGGVPPTLASLYDDPEFQQAYPVWREVRESLENAAVRPVSPAYQSISTLITATLNPVDRIDPPRTVDELAEQVRKAVNSEGLIP